VVQRPELPAGEYKFYINVTEEPWPEGTLSDPHHRASRLLIARYYLRDIRMQLGYPAQQLIDKSVPIGIPNKVDTHVHGQEPKKKEAAVVELLPTVSVEPVEATNIAA